MTEDVLEPLGRGQWRFGRWTIETRGRRWRAYTTSAWREFDRLGTLLMTIRRLEGRLIPDWMTAEQFWARYYHAGAADHD